MTRQIFITGTDTDAGKTFVACVLEQALHNKGYVVRPYKPIVAGFEKGHNADLDNHILASHLLDTPPLDITACAYEEPIAPHIAAEKSNNPISWEALDLGLERALSKSPDFLIVEGAGGWMLPISNTHVLPDWPKMKNMEVILVVGMQLGCLSHALLTAESIRARGLKLLGYITCNVCVDTMPYYEENLKTLELMLKVPCIGQIPHIASRDFRAVNVELDLTLLTENLR